MFIFRRSGGKHVVAVAMTGVKMGDRLLQVGCTDASLLAAISSKVGFSGRACAIVASQADAVRARRGAEAGGILLELETSENFTHFPFDDEAFDVIVVDNQQWALAELSPEHRAACLRQSHRTLARRGRVVVIEPSPRTGLAALLRKSRPLDPAYEASGGTVGSLKSQGFSAVRQLAERDGLSFIEGVR
jgi:ubiquinone/menaquinone biosynthesis C-methylase UbiE